MGTRPEQDTFPSQGHSHTQMGTIQKLFLPQVLIFGRWEETRVWRKPMQTWEECTNNVEGNDTIQGPAVQ